MRYRTRETVEPPHAVSADPVADLAQALNRPIGATAIPIKATVTRTPDRLSLEATLEVDSLDLTPEQNLWTGQVEIMARFTAADGIVFREHVTRYDTAQRDGLPFRNEFEVPPRAVELHLLFGNLASGKIETFTIPLS